MTALSSTDERPESTDDQLMARVKIGSTAAFGELYDRYGLRAYRVAHSVCPCTDHAGDAVQEAFLSIWENRTTYQPARGALAAWLLTVVRHHALDVARRNARPADQPAGDDQFDAGHLRGLLARLPEDQQEIITLAYFGELTHSEIATHFGVPAGTVKSSARLGLLRLRADLDAAA